jgi:hypothetical protein
MAVNLLCVIEKQGSILNGPLGMEHSDALQLLLDQ